jgi:hypothetical protein
MAHDRELISFFFHAPNEEPELVDADLAYSPDGESIGSGGAPPWRSPTMPPCALTMTNEGVVAEEAAAIDVPVLIACGERDVVPDPWAEPPAYRSSHDVSVFQRCVTCTTSLEHGNCCGSALLASPRTSASRSRSLGAGPHRSGDAPLITTSDAATPTLALGVERLSFSPRW